MLQLLVPSLCPLASPATRIPLAQKGGEIPTTKFPAWPKTAGAKAWWFPSPQVDAPRLQGTGRAPLSPGGSLAPSPALQPSPCEYGQEPGTALPTALGFGQGSLGWSSEGPSGSFSSSSQAQILFFLFHPAFLCQYWVRDSGC